MSDDINVEEVMSRRFALDEAIAVIQGRHKGELEPLVEEMRLCELFVKDYMNNNGLQQFKTAAGHQTFFQNKDQVSVEDFDAAISYIVENKAFNLLNRAVNKTAVKEYIEANQSPPPGVKYSSYRDLQWRRGKPAK